MPTAALPLLKSCVVTPLPTEAEMISTLARSMGSPGCTATVFMCNVWLSILMIRSTLRVNCENELGELGTLGTRSQVKITSSAVKGAPLWNTTP